MQSFISKEILLATLIMGAAISNIGWSADAQAENASFSGHERAILNIVGDFVGAGSKLPLSKLEDFVERYGFSKDIPGLEEEGGATAVERFAYFLFRQGITSAKIPWLLNTLISEFVGQRTMDPLTMFSLLGKMWFYINNKSNESVEQQVLFQEMARTVLIASTANCSIVMRLWFVIFLPGEFADEEDLPGAKEDLLLQLLAETLSDRATISVKKLKEVIDVYGFPPEKFPPAVVNIHLAAEKTAEFLVSQGLKRERLMEILQRAFALVKASGRKVDPFNSFNVVAALLRILEPGNVMVTEKAFKLIARATMNAPFANHVPNHAKRNAGSFEYVVELGYCWTRMQVVESSGSERAADYWQIYFHDVAYPLHAMPWLESLYHFYQREADWLITNPHPFDSKETHEMLLAKIARRGDYYDIESDGQKCREYAQHLMGEMRAGAPVQDLNSWLGDHYAIVDTDIYWYYLSELAGKPPAMQQGFWQAMIKAGADPFTIIDIEGTTPLKLAEKFHLGIIRDNILGLAPQGSADVASVPPLRETPASNIGNAAGSVKAPLEHASPLTRKRQKLISPEPKLPSQKIGATNPIRRPPLARIDENIPQSARQTSPSQEGTKNMSWRLRDFKGAQRASMTKIKKTRTSMKVRQYGNTESPQRSSMTIIKTDHQAEHHEESGLICDESAELSDDDGEPTDDVPATPDTPISDSEIATQLTMGDEHLEEGLGDLL